MKCREFVEFIADYLAGEMPAGTRDQFEAHLRRCVNCRAYLSSYQATIELGRRAFADEDADVPLEVPAELVRAILDSRKP